MTLATLTNSLSAAERCGLIEGAVGRPLSASCCPRRGLIEAQDNPQTLAGCLLAAVMPPEHLRPPLMPC